MSQGFISQNNPIMAVILVDIAHYWTDSNGVAIREVTFPIDPDYISRLLAESPTNQILFQVTNLGNPTKVKGAWKPLKNENVNSSRNFVLPQNLVNNLTRGFAAPTIVNPDKFVVARFLKDTQGINRVFFHRFIGGYEDGGTGGDNASAGALIPPHP
jgi:hypothetical protein